ncbi:MAG: 3-oxoacyl-[acyl-carrier-protein] reductase [Dehalococcoidales bacterium]|nr:MAG: 3-oxoacyl-[acyl-carrier-protein] reductase [Dehalococcoidales bacterium]
MGTESKDSDKRVALVTGASRGLGRAVAIELATCGIRVVVNYLTNDREAHKVDQEIKSLGGEAMLYKTDVSDATAVRKMTRQIVEQWGKIDILVNNAGIVRDTLLLRMPDEAWDEVINTNLRGAYLCTKYALRSMMEQGWGRIINIASLAGLVGNAGQANYSAAKGGLIAFTKSVAREVGPRNITANAISPGFIVTEMTDKLPQEARDAILARIPLGRFGVADDVAGLTAFLASEQASYITAQVICVDGGVI